MTLLSKHAQTVHTPEGRYLRLKEPPFEGELACGHRPLQPSDAWQRVRSLQAQPELPETICSGCLNEYMAALTGPQPKPELQSYECPSDLATARFHCSCVTDRGIDRCCYCGKVFRKYERRNHPMPRQSDT